MKKALITGASSGLGKELAYQLSELGYELILVARDKKGLEETKKNCKTEAKIYICNLTKEENVIKMYEENKNVDLLINNAGFGLFGYFHETDLQKELEMIDVNIKALHILTKLYLKDFIKKDSGRILNVGSVAGFQAGPKLSTYYSTKNYVVKQTLAISHELKELNSNVKISVLCPGPFNSKFNETAGAKFNSKNIESKEIAKYAIKKMFTNKIIIMPGLIWKTTTFMSRFMPYSILMKITSNFQDKKQK